MTAQIDKVQIRTMLQEARREMARSLGSRDEVRIEPSSEAMDQVQAAAARELATRNLDRSARWLRQIETALHRLETGGYGYCENCAEDIGPNRHRSPAALGWLVCASVCVWWEERS